MLVNWRVAWHLMKVQKLLTSDVPLLKKINYIYIYIYMKFLYIYIHICESLDFIEMTQMTLEMRTPILTHRPHHKHTISANDLGQQHKSQQ